MTRLDRFNKNIELINIKFNDTIKLVDDTIDYLPSIEKVEWICLTHNIQFISSINILLDKRRINGCPICCINNKINSFNKD